MDRAELLQAVIAERWPRPEEIAREHPEHVAYRRRVLNAAMAPRPQSKENPSGHEDSSPSAP